MCRHLWSIMQVPLAMHGHRSVDDMDSAGVLRLADRVASGKLSVKGAGETADMFVKDGCCKADA